MATKQESNPDLKRIGDAFKRNISRTRALVAASGKLGARGAGRRSEVQVDVLRAAVVLLHATIETLLRDLLITLLPKTTSPENLKGLDLRFPTSESSPEKGPQKVEVSDLVSFRGVTVDELVDQAIRRNLETATFNNVGDVAGACKRLGTTFPDRKLHGGAMQSLMKRRHLIAHRGDAWAERTPRQGVSALLPLQKADVDAWTVTVETVGTGILNQLRSTRGQRTA